ncbi:Mov34/MPN/PAD-1 family protein [Dyella flagellata]|uniref:Mov34/MPN/PAD-1 family protein n=1 Tax=Dyella flagellata TaxID=1867833 RepID=UPI0024E0947B|nr:Mov34/MPN/PAD-1 family protein [Dyella flagellata]
MIEPSVLEVLDQFRQDTTLKPESGGILLGYRRGLHLHIVEATRPMQDDRRSRFSFDRAPHGHRQVAMRRWQESNRQIDYLGEWHSHPESFPSPSSIDIRGWQALAASQGKPMLFIIVGNDTTDWFGVGVGTQITQLTF